MSPPVKPAMTAEEWHVEQVLRDYAGRVRRVGTHVEVDGHHFTIDEGHALAALALHGQPFGFTWDDVDALRSTAEDYDGEPAQEAAPALRDLADRIAALLPPREP